MRRGKFVQKTQTTAFLGMREESYAQSIKYVTVKLCNAPALKREMVVQEEGQIMQTEHDQTIELSMVSMDLTLLHCPLCLRPLKPLVYEVQINLVLSVDRARCKFLD